MQKIVRSMKAMAFLLGGTAAIADAQQTFFPSSVSVLVDNWNYVPVFEGSGSGAAVHSIVAFSEVGTTIGDNLVAVWYVRQGDSWIQKSWSEKDRWAIVQQIKGDLSIGGEYDFRWGVAGANNQGVADQPVAVGNGVLATDPLATVMESVSDPKPLLETLVGQGYEAVKTPTDFSAAGCAVDSMLGDISLAVAAEGAAEEPETLPVAMALANSGFKACAGTVVTPISTKPVGPPTVWLTPRTCLPFAFPDCKFAESCTATRTQTFVRKRTRTCLIGGVLTFCDQRALLTCSETDTCYGPVVPGFSGGDGCVPPAAFPPAPAAPCGPHGPTVPILTPLWPMDPSVPGNCTVSPGGWVPPNSSCACS